MAEWDHTADLVVVGSGGGLVGALAAADEGLDVLVVEKRRLVGGSTAMSGGIAWIPGNPLMAAEGVADSFEDAMAYLEDVVGDVGPASSPARRAAFLRAGPEMIRFLQDRGVRFVRCAGYSDYYAERRGGKAAGRSVETEPFDVRRLGPWRDKLQPGFLGGARVAVRTGELAAFSLPFRTPANLRVAARVAARTALARLRGRHLVSNGAALVGRLLELALREEIPIWTGASFADVVVEGGRVVGVVVERGGRVQRVRARRGVLLAAGGFARNAELRRSFGGDQPNDASWTSANPGDTGEVLQAAMRLGAATDLLDEAWWVQTSFLPGGKGLMHITERARPGSIIVDAGGSRYVNEAASYMEVGQAMYRRDRTVPAIPSWIVFDARFRRRYPWVMAPPVRTPRAWIEQGYMKRAGTLEDLARQCGIDPAGLVATVERFNRDAARGVDPDFHRGAGAYDRYFGDPAHRPNPSLGPLDEAPFHAVAVYPGDVGTCGGLLTDEHARVVRADGSVIEGLYATGNITATVFGRAYPGAGASIGYSMAFALVAARHAAASGPQSPT